MNNISCKSGIPEKEAERARIEKLIEEASTNTRYSQYQARRAELLSLRIQTLKDKLHTASPSKMSSAHRQIDTLHQELCKKRVDGRIYVHIDLDAFYAAVEERDHPEWRGKPLAVGGMSMLSTANYEARKFGVSAAMPGYIAMKLCPDLLMVPMRFPAYEDASEQARKVMRLYDPSFHSFSLDEASLDLTDYINTSKDDDIESIVTKIRKGIEEATGGLTCSAGIACNRFLSKLASNLNKPDGQYCLLDRDPHAFVLEQPIRRLWGVGKVTAALLKGVLDVSNCQELWEQRHTFPIILTPAITRNILRCLLGISAEEDSGASMAAQDRSSKSCETTFTSIFGPKLAQVKDILEELSNELADSLKSEERKALSIGLKIKTADFDVFTRTETLTMPTDDPEVMLEIACRLFKRCKPESVRLLGIRASKFSHSSTSTSEASTSNNSSKKRPLDEFLVDAQNLPKCPICGLVLTNTFDAEINAHIDECLANNPPSSSSPRSSSSKAQSAKPQTPQHKGGGPMDKFLFRN